MADHSSDNRIKRCPVASRCGGCRWIGIDYREQLKAKQTRFRKLMEPYCRPEEMIGMEEPEHYRNKVHAVFGEDKKHNIISGIYEEKSHRIVPVDSCLIEDSRADEIIVSVRGLLRSFKIRPYNEDTGYGLLRHVLVRTGRATGQIMVVLVLASPVMPSKNHFVEALLKLHPEITTIVINVNNRDTSMVLGEKEQVIYGRGYIEDELCGRIFRISPKSFYQVNAVQAGKLYGKVLEYAELTGRETVVDAYCGTGTIGIAAADGARRIIGVELNPDAVRDARSNAKRNDVKNIEFYQNDAGRFLAHMAEQGERADVILMDPPRSGSSEEFLNAVAKLSPGKVIYVSCNPDTLVRDLKYLIKKGYEVIRCAAVDMFPFTEEIESVCLLSRGVKRGGGSGKMDKKRNILGNKIYLYLTEFFAGMSVMAVELGASRLLAPYFSSSQIVWTIIIGTIMIAMALGNVWGGRKADRDPNPDRLYGRILIAAVWIAAIPVFGKYIIVAVSGLLIIAVSNGFLIIAAFISCMVIFVFPLFLLGTVTPSLAKYAVGNLEESGKTIGTLGAFNTIGSIIGTFVPTFISIPAVGTSVTFLIFAAILLALALIYFVSEKLKPARAAVSVILVLLCSIFGHSASFAFWEGDLTYEGESIYNYLQVKDTERSTILSTNVLFGVQSIAMKGDSLTGLYYDYALAAPYMVSELEGQEILILGMGTGTYAGQCARYLQDAVVEGVEIDRKITDLAHRYFSLPESVKVTTYDGRAYLQAVEEKYDVIMVDAYQDITIPFQMSTVEFFTQVRDHLKEGGVMVVNMNMHASESLKADINVYLADTIAGVFSEVYVADVPHCTNRELFASMSPGMTENLKKHTAAEENRELKRLMEEIGMRLTGYEAGENILTDDRAPVELLGMRMIDSIIKDEIGYYKGIFREQGLEGLLNSM